MPASKGQATLAALGILIVGLFIAAVVVNTIMWAKGAQVTHELDVSININDLGKELNGILASKTSDIRNMEIAGGFFASGHESFTERNESLNDILEKTKRFLMISGKDNFNMKVGSPSGEPSNLTVQIAVPGAGKSRFGTRGTAELGG